MGRDTHKQIRFEVAKLLRVDWNPIGLTDLPENEYDSYAYGIVPLLLKEADRNQIKNKLHAALENMGLENLKKDEKYSLKEGAVIEKLLLLQRNK